MHNYANALMPIACLQWHNLGTCDDGKYIKNTLGEYLSLLIECRDSLRLKIT